MATLDACASCGRSAEGLKRCSRCQRVAYCDTNCQAAHFPEHKLVCARLRKSGPTDVNEQCPICLYPVRDAEELPCSHRLCRGCHGYMLNVSDSANVCPLCQGPLGPEKIENLKKAYVLIARATRALQEKESAQARKLIAKATAQARRALKRAPADIDAHQLLDVALKLAGDSNGRLEAFQKLLDARPRKEGDARAATVWNNYGNALFEVAKAQGSDMAASARAAAAYRRAIEIFEDLGQHSAHRGPLDAAIADRAGYTSRGFDAAGAYASLGFSLRPVDRDGSYRALTKALELGVGPDQLADVHSHLGKLCFVKPMDTKYQAWPEHLELAPGDECVHHLRTALDSGVPDDHRAHTFYILGLALAQRGEFADAARAFESAVAALAPGAADRPDHWWAEALARLLSGDGVGALRKLRACAARFDFLKEWGLPALVEEARALILRNGAAPPTKARVQFLICDAVGPLDRIHLPIFETEMVQDCQLNSEIFAAVRGEPMADYLSTGMFQRTMVMGKPGGLFALMGGLGRPPPSSSTGPLPPGWVERSTGSGAKSRAYYVCRARETVTWVRPD